MASSLQIGLNVRKSFSFSLKPFLNVMCRNNILSMRQWKKIGKGELKIIL
jgi:hypothetical protein